jgi:hypothetical protein
MYFISHNKKQKPLARLLATTLAANGQSVWFDEWNLRPGDSLIGGIENGLAEASVFVIIWSQESATSNWVGTELRAYLRRRVDDNTLRIIPIMVDDTPLPALLADYLGFAIRSKKSIAEVAARISGSQTEASIVRLLNERLQELTIDQDAGHDPLPFKRCPSCGEDSFERKTLSDPHRDEEYYVIRCTKCDWSDWTQ